MSNAVNFNKARKERDRSSRKARAAENSVRFGQSKSERDAIKARAEIIRKNLDAHKSET
jgi:hypothetical protein